MSLLWIEGFDSFGASGTPVGLAGKYVSNSLTGFPSIQTGRHAQVCLRLKAAGFATTYVTTPNLGDHTTLVTGFAFMHNGAPQAAPIVSFREHDDATLGMDVRLKADGALEIYRAGSLVATSASASIIAADRWYYIEVLVTIHDSAGVYEVRVNGADVLSASGVDTKAGTAGFLNRIRLHGGATNRSHQFDDWYILNDSGSANNDFLGERLVVTRFPDSAGSSTDFTPDSGDNYARVDDTSPDEDTSYVSSATTGHKDLYNFGPVIALEDINGVQSNFVARKTDTTNFDLIPVVLSGATEVQGDSLAIDSEDYLTVVDIFEDDPDTTAPWLAADLSDAEFGFEVG